MEQLAVKFQEAEPQLFASWYCISRFDSSPTQISVKNISQMFLKHFKLPLGKQLYIIPTPVQ